MTELPPFAVRRVVTTTDAVGVASDGPPPLTISAPAGFGVSELLWLDGPPATPDDGGDRAPEGFPLEPPAGGLSSRIIRMPGNGDWLRVEGDDPEHPGMHATDTLDLMVVLHGEIVMGLADGTEHVVRAGDAVVQRGTAHRWRVAADGPCTYWVTMLRPQPASSVRQLATRSGRSRFRRFVTGGDGVAVGSAPVALEVGATTLVDLWQTGGPVASVLQGGDPPEGPWALEPIGGGVAMRLIELQPGPRPEDEGWHRTATIDIDVILAGRMALELPAGVRTELSAGDVVVQRGTDHRWVPLGDEPVRMAAVMIAAGGAGA